MVLERSPGALEEQRVADGELRLAGKSSPLRCTASTTRSPLSVTIPGNTVSPISAERGGTTTSAMPDRG